MKHKTITITGSDLENSWSSDNNTPAEVAGFDKIDPAVMYEVNWPEHVSLPLYDEDCTIAEANLDNVIRLGNGSLICADCLGQEYPDMQEPVTGWRLGPCHYHRQIHK